MSRHHQQIKNDPRWKAARLLVLERDGHQCTECGTDEDLQVDHVLGLAHVLEDTPELAFEPDNLITLCGPHNREKHHRTGDNEIERREWINDDYIEIRNAIESSRSLSG